MFIPQALDMAVGDGRWLPCPMPTLPACAAQPNGCLGGVAATVTVIYHTAAISRGLLRSLASLKTCAPICAMRRLCPAKTENRKSVINFGRPCMDLMVADGYRADHSGTPSCCWLASDRTQCPPGWHPPTHSLIYIPRYPVLTGRLVGGMLDRP